MGEQKKIFISYSSKDKLLASRMCAYLEQRGLICWIAPRDIMPGHEYAESIIDGIDGSSQMIVIFNQHSNASPHVRNEIERAFHKRLVIIPFRTEDILPARSLEYFLSSTHWLDATEGNAEKYFQSLYQSCQKVNKPQPTIPVSDVSTASIQRKQINRKWLGVAITAMLLVGVVAYMIVKNNNPDTTVKSLISPNDTTTIINQKDSLPDALDEVRKKAQGNPQPVRTNRPDSVAFEKPALEISTVSPSYMTRLEGITFGEAGSPDYIQFSSASGSTIFFTGKIEIYPFSGSATLKNNVLILTGKDVKGKLSVSSDADKISGMLDFNGTRQKSVVFSRQ